MPKYLLLLAVVLHAGVVNAGAQECRMSIEDVLASVASSNKDVRAQRSRHAVDVQEIAVAESARLPQINASLDLNYLGDGTVIDRDFSKSMRDKLPHFGNTLNVSLYQPVYQGGAITAGIKMARLNAELSQIGVDQQTDASAIEVLSSYFNLVKMQNLRKVYVENIDVTEKLIDHMKERYSQGTALHNDITRYELRLSTLNYELQCIDNSISVLNNNLVSLLGLDADAQIMPVCHDIEPEIPDEQYWLSLTGASSSELRAIDKSREIAETGLRLDRAARLPKIGIVIGDQLLGPVTFEIPAINKNYNAWFAGVSIKYELSSLWTAPKKERKRQLEIAAVSDNRAAVSDLLVRKVHESFIALQQARQMLATEKVNVHLANENYSVVNTRFENDMALLTDMLDASVAKLDSEIRLVNARINILLAFYQLKFISGTLNK